MSKDIGGSSDKINVCDFVYELGYGWDRIYGRAIMRLRAQPRRELLAR